MVSPAGASRGSRSPAIDESELLASLGTAAAIGALFLNYLGAHLTFFGEPVDIDADAVRNYCIAVGVLVCSLLTSFAAAVWRRAGKSFVWHSLMAVTGLVASFAFAVTHTGPPTSSNPERPEPARYGSVCHSGGDNDECVGG